MLWPFRTINDFSLIRLLKALAENAMEELDSQPQTMEDLIFFLLY